MTLSGKAGILLPLAVWVLFTAQEARCHGFSDIEGTLSVEPNGAQSGDTATLSMMLREKAEGALVDVSAEVRIQSSESSFERTFHLSNTGRYITRVPLDSGFHQVRIVLTTAKDQEFAFSGFSVKPSLQTLEGEDSRLEFVPKGKWDAIPWLDHLSGIVIGLAGISALMLIWRKKASQPEKVPGSGGVSPWVLGAAALGSITMPLGAYWDIAFHFSRGRDTFFSPPHLLIYGGIVLVSSALFSGLRITAAMLGWRNLITKASPATLAALGLAAQLASAPFDELWHYLFGLDVGIWSPPHAILIAGGFTACLSLAFLPVQISTYRASFFRVILFAGALLIGNVFLAEAEFPFPFWHVSNTRPEAVYPILLGLFSLIVLVSARKVLPFRYAFLAISGMYVAARMALYPLLSRMGSAVAPTLPDWIFIPLIIAFFTEILVPGIFRPHFKTAFGSKEDHV